MCTKRAFKFDFLENESLYEKISFYICTRNRLLFGFTMISETPCIVVHSSESFWWLISTREMIFSVFPSKDVVESVQMLIETLNI